MNEVLFFSVKHKNKLLIFLTFFILFFSFFIKDIKFTGSSNKFFIKNDPSYIFYKNILKKFGSDNEITISIQGDNLFTHKNLTIIYKMITEIKQLDGILEINSLFNKKNIVYKNNALYTNVFIDPYNIPIEKKQLEEIKNDALNNPLIYKNLISDNGKILLLNIKVINSSKHDFNIKITHQIENILQKYQNKLNANLTQFGTAYISEEIIKYISHDMKFNIPIAILIIFIIIYFILKNIKLTLIPIITSTLTIIVIFGFMGLTGIEVSILTAVIPALIILIGTTEDSYLIHEFVEEKNKLHTSKDIMIKIISKKLSLSIILTSITTIIGFASIYVNKIVILQDFAIVSAFGLFVNFLITIILVPIIFHSFNIKIHYEKTIKYTKILNFANNIFLYHTKKLYFILFLALSIFISFIPKILLDNNILGYFKENSQIIKRANYFKTYTNGIQSFYIIVKTPKKNNLKKWKYLHAIEKIQSFINSKKSKFNYSLSVANYIELINKEMHNGNNKFYKIPKSNFLISQYYMFFHRKYLKDYIDEKYQIAKIDVWHNIFSSKEFNKEKQLLENFIQKNIDPSIQVIITGKNVLLNKAVDTISIGQTKSMMMLFVIVFILISIAFKNIKAGFVVLIGNIIPIVSLFGIMGMFGIPLNVVTAVIATITFGIVVDDTIHLMIRYKYEHKNCNKITAISNTIKGEGRAVLMTTFSLIAGYTTLIYSNFIPVIQFAILSIIVIFIAMLSDLFFIPSLLKKINITKD